MTLSITYHFRFKLQNSVSAISSTNTGSAFGLPGTTTSLVHATSANPTFKVKGLTSSNSIVFGVSMDTVDISIDPVLIGRISTLESKNSSQDTFYNLIEYFNHINTIFYYS